MDRNISAEALATGVQLTYQPVTEKQLPEDTEFSRWLLPGVAEIRGTGFMTKKKVGVFSVEKGLLAEVKYASAVASEATGTIALVGKPFVLMTSDGKALTGEDCEEAMALGEGLYATRVKKDWTIRRMDTREPVSGRTWRSLLPFDDGCSVAGTEKGYQLIGTDGEPLFPDAWDEAHPFRNGYARVGSRKEIRYIDREGKTLFTAGGRYSRDFCNGYAVFQDKSGKYGVINERGETVIRPHYLYIKDCSNGMFVVSNTGMSTADHTGFNGRDYGLVRADDSQVLPLSYSKVEPRQDGSYLYGHLVTWQVRSGNMITNYGVLVHGILGPDGRIVLPDEYVSIGEESEGLIAFKRYVANKLEFGYMTPEGKRVFTFADVDYSCDNDETRAMVRDDMNTQMRPFSNGKAMVCVRNDLKTGINMFRKSNWYAAVKGDWYLIDRNGKPAEADPEDRLLKDPLSSTELPFGDYVRGLNPVFRNLVREMAIEFDDYYEVNLAKGAFAILDRDLHCLCSNYIPGTTLDSVSLTSPAHPRVVTVKQIAPKVWITATEQAPSVTLSDFESPTLFSSGLAPFNARIDKKKVLWGYMDREGNTVVEPRFTEAGGFENGYAVAKDGKNTVLLSRDVEAMPLPARNE